MATHFNILAWRIPWTEEPGGLQSMGLQIVGHDWSNLARTPREACIWSHPLLSSAPSSPLQFTILISITSLTPLKVERLSSPPAILQRRVGTAYNISLGSIQLRSWLQWGSLQHIITVPQQGCHTTSSFPLIILHRSIVEFSQSSQEGFSVFGFCLGGFLTAWSVHCCAWAFSSCNKWGLLSSCKARASHCGGFSCCRAQSL